MYETSYKFVMKNSDGDKVIVKTVGVDLTALCEAFESFLKASGFSFKGTVQIIDEEFFDNEAERRNGFDQLLDTLDDDTTSGAV